MGQGHNFGYRKRQIVDGKMDCQICLQHLPVDSFYVNPHNGRRDQRCDRCRKAACCARNLAITVERYLSLIATGRCEICDTATNDLCVDHDHSTGKIRGVLCGPCNQALGLFKDNYVSLVQAAYYISKYEDLHLDLPVTDEDRLRNKRMRLLRRR